jgi:UDP-2,3-diacylglucosamine pyrophosphatase LpxH
MKKQKYKTVIISDTHLGKPNAQTEKLLEFLSNMEIETLIINGDLIDFWQLSILGKWTDKESNIMNYIIERTNK